jgi:hypothetical protein
VPAALTGFVDCLPAEEVEAAAGRELVSLVKEHPAVPRCLAVASSRASDANTACSATHSGAASDLCNKLTTTTVLIMKLASALSAASLLFLMLTAHSFAQSCTSTKCFQGLFGPQCVRFACSSDAQCPADRPSCFNGICRICAVPSGGGGTGTGQSGEGGPCGPQTFGGGIVKSIGCKRGLFCTFGRCLRPLS